LTTDKLRAIGEMEGVGSRGDPKFNADLGNAFQQSAMQVWKGTAAPNNRSFFSFTRLVHSLWRAYVKPDGLGDFILRNPETDEVVGTYPQSIFYEVKAVKGTLHLSSNEYQLRGMIDALTRTKAGGPGLATPALVLLTTWDTYIGADVIKYANDCGVIVAQSWAYLTSYGWYQPYLGFTPAHALNPGAAKGVPFSLLPPGPPVSLVLRAGSPDPGDPDPPVVQ
jgi:hypothetical protein